MNEIAKYFELDVFGVVCKLFPFSDFLCAIQCITYVGIEFFDFF